MVWVGRSSFVLRKTTNGDQRRNPVLLWPVNLSGQPERLRIRTLRRGLLLVVWTMIAQLTMVRAEVVLNNLATAGVNANFGMLNPGQGQAIKFATGAQTYSLDSITVRVAGDSFWSWIEPRTATVSLRLYGDAGGSPGGLLADFGLRTLTGSNVVLEAFTPSTPSLLTPNTSYWVAIVKQAQTENTRTTWYSGGLTGGTIFTDPQSGWQLFHGAIGTRDDGQTWSQPTSFEGAIQIAASIVPEPASPIMFSLFCFAMLLKRGLQTRGNLLTNTSPESASTL
jgi:hypothetical protein